ncbi:uncharacterized protein LOC143509347 [Brachyhypopomus gauderio]|uniref:uncharacterized protein LOC143509347 n=1 Tax=Brachyhypopomus gauderio TaxID=698409 RepID=UPI004041374E
MHPQPYQSHSEQTMTDINSIEDMLVGVRNPTSRPTPDIPIIHHPTPTTQAPRSPKVQTQRPDPGRPTHPPQRRNRSGAGPPARAGPQLGVGGPRVPPPGPTGEASHPAEGQHLPPPPRPGPTPQSPEGAPPKPPPTTARQGKHMPSQVGSPGPPAQKVAGTSSLPGVDPQPPTGPPGAEAPANHPD